jgi:hypothetical protein
VSPRRRQPHAIERIGILMDAHPRHRDADWLAEALQSAVTLEFSTIPPYLCALWSIIDQGHEAASYIRTVVQEEMLHMSLACNMLTAIGHVPRINVAANVPHYPTHLPGHVKPKLRVALAGLSANSLGKFIEIEAPEPPSDRHQAHDDDSFCSIGEFYDAIRDSFRRQRPSISTERQVSGPQASMVMTDLHSVYAAIALIKHQGEGTRANARVPGTDDLAHYFRFLSVQHNREVIGLRAGKPVFAERAWEAPEVWPMAPVPAGGYLADEVAPPVAQLLRQFDLTYTRLLDLLQATWEHGDQGSLVRGIDTMFALADTGRELMQIPRPTRGRSLGNYGPCFRYLGSGPLDRQSASSVAAKKVPGRWRLVRCEDALVIRVVDFENFEGAGRHPVAGFELDGVVRVLRIAAVFDVQ